MPQAEQIYFYGTELKGVYSGWRFVTPLSVGRKWVKIKINGGEYRVLKEQWEKWPRYSKRMAIPTVSRACETKKTKRVRRKA